MHQSPASAEALIRLYDGLRIASKGSGKGKDRSRDTGRQNKFQDLRDHSGLTVVRKTDGVALLGSRAGIDAWKGTLEECIAEAGMVPAQLKLTTEQARLWTIERVEAVKTASGAKVQLIRRGKHGENSVLELIGTDEEKEKATAEVEKAHETMSYCESLYDVSSAATRSLTAKSTNKLGEIEKRHDVSISIDRKTQEVKITGTESNVVEAKKELEEAISAAGDSVSHEMEIDWEDGGVVIGRGGATVQSIRQACGIEDLQVETVDERKRVVIKGTKAAVDAAVKMVE